MLKNEQYYKLLSKTKLNKLIYCCLNGIYKKNNKDLSLFEREDISLLRKNAGDSSLVKRNNEWLKSEYDLDIIIPVYNTGNMLDKCLTSVLSQKTQYDFRAIVIDDGSNDKVTLDILEKYSGNDRILIIHTQNNGISEARNIGIEKSKGEYLMFLDSDDLLELHAIENLMNKAYDENVDIVEGAYDNISANNNILKVFPHKSGKLDDRNDMYGYPWGKVIKRNLFLSVKFPKFFFEDSIMKTIIYPSTELKHGISDVVYHYRRNRNSISFTSQGNKKSLDSYWITHQINIDREELGLKADASYYEYMLNMAKLTFRRNIHLENKYMIDLFSKICDDMEEYSMFFTNNEHMKDLELAIRTRNYRLFCLWNTMNMF